MSEIKTTLDENMDILSMVKSNEENRQKTPLQQMEESRQLGISVEKGNFESSELDKKFENGEMNTYVENASREVAEYDELIEKAKLVKIIHKPKNENELVQLINELSSVSLEDLRAAKAEMESNEKAPQELVDVNLSDDEISSIIGKPSNGGNADVLKSSKFLAAGNNESANENTDIEVEDDDGANAMSDKRKKQIQIIIDKTGVANINFTEEERAKLAVSESIELKEVSSLELSSAKVVKATRSFAEMISDDSYNTYGVRTAMVFPCSKFRGYLSGMSYGELGDVGLSFDNEGYDTIKKKLSVIYNKMINPSCGKFKDFDDFLQKFAYIDVELAIYALYISSTPETKTITLKCNNDGCGQRFDWDFRTRELIQYQDASDVFLDCMEEIATANTMEAIKMNQNAPHRTEKLIELPLSHIIVKLSHVSCYDYLNKILLETLKDDDFEKRHPDDVNGVLQSSAIILPIVSGFRVKNPNGTHEEFSSVDDILEMCYHLPPSDFQILLSLVQSYLDDYSISFGIRNVVCPHCKQKTEFVPINITQQVFQLYQTQLSTSVNLKNLPRL